MPHAGGKEHPLLSRHKDQGLVTSNERKQDTSCEHQEQEDFRFQDSSGYIVRPCLDKQLSVTQALQEAR